MRVVIRAPRDSRLSEELDCRVMTRIIERIRCYASLPLGFADSTVVACAERSDAPVTTLGRRDFTVLAREGKIVLALDQPG